MSEAENQKRSDAIEKFIKKQYVSKTDLKLREKDRFLMIEQYIVDGWKVGVREKTDREIVEQLNRTDIIPEWRSILLTEQKLRERTAKIKVAFS